MVAVAVNVAEAPAHSGFVPDVNAMATAGVRLALITMVIPLDVAVVGLAHVKLEVITQVTICPLVKVVVVNVGLLVPAFTPFTFHWYVGVIPPFAGVAVKVAEAPAHCGLLPAV